MVESSNKNGISKTAFTDINLHPLTQQAIAGLGFEFATEVQEQSLPETTKGGDIIVKAKTGSGKTLVFLATLSNFLHKQQLLDQGNIPQSAWSVIISPTRELADQIYKEAKNLFKEDTKIGIHLLIGGENREKQAKHLRRRPQHIIVATPGRLADLMETGDVDLSQAKHFVLDEVDRLLDLGFLPQINHILRKLPKKKQSLVFSATISPAVKKIIRKSTYEPKLIEIEQEHDEHTSIEQVWLSMDSRNRILALTEILRSGLYPNAIIFVTRKRTGEWLNKELRDRRIDSGLLMGDINQQKRTRIVKRFKENTLPFLIATDVASRGLDVPGLPLVINFELPMNPEDYIHRIGRTGRAGLTGKAVNFVSESNVDLMSKITKLLKVEVTTVHFKEFRKELKQLARPKPKTKEEKMEQLEDIKQAIIEQEDEA